MLLFLLLFLLVVGLGYFIFSPMFSVTKYSELKSNILLTNQSIFFFGINLLITSSFWIFFDKSTHEFQFIENNNYLNIIGIDGISLFFIILTSLLIFLCLVDSWNYKVSLSKNQEFIIYFLLLDLFLIFSFITLDLLVFYVFFESVLIPMFLIIGIWGSRERKIQADFYFFIYTFLGSILMFFCILILLYETYSTNFLILQNTFFESNKECLLWFFSFIAFSVKIPMFPFHLWLPEAHVEAPTAGSVILAGLLLKLGGYGYLRFVLPLFPYASYYYFPIVAIFGIISIIYASLTTIRQVDLKRIIAYSSVAHMNVVLLGLFAANPNGLQGAVFLMLAHGIVSSALFFIIGNLYKRHGTRLLNYYGGLAFRMPLFSIYLLIFCLANVGTPLTFNFIGELMIFISLVDKNFFILILSASSVVLSVIYTMWFFNRIVFGGLKVNFIKTWSDITRKENFIFFILLFLTFLFGIFPNLILDYTYVSSNYLYELIQFKLINV